MTRPEWIDRSWVALIALSLTACGGSDVASLDGGADDAYVEPAPEVELLALGTLRGARGEGADRDVCALWDGV